MYSIPTPAPLQYFERHFLDFYTFPSCLERRTAAIRMHGKFLSSCPECRLATSLRERVKHLRVCHANQHVGHPNQEVALSGFEPARSLHDSIVCARIQLSLLIVNACSRCVPSSQFLWLSRPVIPGGLPTPTRFAAAFEDFRVKMDLGDTPDRELPTMPLPPDAVSGVCWDDPTNASFSAAAQFKDRLVKFKAWEDRHAEYWNRQGDTFFSGACNPKKEDCSKSSAEPARRQDWGGRTNATRPTSLNLKKSISTLSPSPDALYAARSEHAAPKPNCHGSDTCKHLSTIGGK